MTAQQTIRKPIMATAIYERWNRRDEAIEMHRVEFDATRIVAGLSEDEREQLMNGGFEIADDIFREAESRGLIPVHDGPFTLDVEDRIAEALEADPEYFAQPFPEGREVRHEDAVLETPLTPYEQGYRSGEDYSVSGLVVVSMADLHDRDFEGHLDNISMLLVGQEALMEVDSSAKRVTAEGDLVMLVTGVVVPGDFFDEEELVEFEAGRAAAAAQGAESAE